jgi:hypothetical protein
MITRIYKGEDSLPRDSIFSNNVIMNQCSLRKIS